MFGQTSKRFFIGMSVVSLLTPIAIMVWSPKYGALAFITGIAIAARCLRLIRMVQLEGVIQDQQALNRKRNQGQTIFVQLIDNDGNDLPPDVARARLADAELYAGPRDTVVGVKRIVHERTL